MLGSTDGGNTITARGDQPNGVVAAGEPYLFRYRFTKFKMVREIGGGKAAVNSVRTQIRNAKIRYHETGYFQVRTLPEHRTEGLYTYDGTVSAVRNAAIGAPPPGAVNPDTPRYFEGVFTVPIYGQGIVFTSSC